MALIAEVVTFQADPSNGTQDVALTQFGSEAPKCIIGISGGRESLGQGNDNQSYHVLGFAASPTQEHSICGYATTAGAAEISWRRSDSTFLMFNRSNEQPRRRLSLTALQPNNVQLNLSGNTSLTPFSTLLALGGSDLTNVAAVQWQMRSDAGPQTVGGFGFTPNAAITITAVQTIWDNGSAGINWMASIWSGSETRTIELLSRNNENPIIPYQTTSNSALELHGNLLGTDILKRATLTGWNSDGFDLNWSDVTNTSQWQCATIAFECDTEIGLELSPNQATPPNRPVDTTTTHTPRAVFFMSPSRDWLDADIDGNSQSMGLTDGSNDGCASWANRTGVQGNTPGRLATAHYNSLTHDLTDYTDSATDETASGALLANAIRSDFDLADTTQRAWAYLSFGEPGGAPPTLNPSSRGSLSADSGGDVILTLRPASRGSLSADSAGDVQKESPTLNPASRGSLSADSAGDVDKISPTLFPASRGSLSADSTGNVLKLGTLNPASRGSLSADSAGDLLVVLQPASRGSLSADSAGDVLKLGVLNPASRGSLSAQSTGNVLRQPTPSAQFPQNLFRIPVDERIFRF